MLTDLTGASLSSWRSSKTNSMQHEACLEQYFWNWSSSASWTKEADSTCVEFLPSVPKRTDVAVSSLTTPKAVYFLPSGQLCPVFTTNHSGVQIRCNQSAKVWSMTIIQGDCCSPQDLCSLTGCGQFFTLCQPWFHSAAPRITVLEWLWCTEWRIHWKTIFWIQRGEESMSCRIFKLWKC